MNFRQFITREREEMLRHKWIESEKAGRDLGDQALFDWIEKHADDFHQRMSAVSAEPHAGMR